MDIDLKTVLLTDECRASLDGPDGWSRAELGLPYVWPDHQKRDGSKMESV